MSPVFRHGRLRLYLLKLLDESPRHGYEVIRLLQDRFMGVYSPSPGTIYPRLARLEEEGLVTHDISEGRKVYRITEKGRQELHSRAADLIELEAELTASVRDIAREVTEDVRETVRNLREELTWAARDMRRGGRPAPPAHPQGEDSRERSRSVWEEAGTRGRGGPGRAEAGEAGTDDRGEPGRAESTEAGTESRDKRRGAGSEETREEGARGPGKEGWAERGKDGWGEPGGAGWGERGWGSWDWQAWTGWPGRRGHQAPPGWPDPRAFRDLEKLARDFTRDLRTAAWHAQTVSEEAVGDLRSILEEALDRVKREVFQSPGSARKGTPDE
jgi:DNA-binding PadR family transcriptional regulator